MSINKWQSVASGTRSNLHPELVKLGEETGLPPASANGRNQAYFAGVWVGFYAGYGATPWQLGDARVCVQREAIVALLTKGDEPVVVSQSARVRKDIAGVLAAASAEAPKPVAAPLASVVAPAIDVSAVVVAALAAGKTADEVIAIIAALKA